MTEKEKQQYRAFVFWNCVSSHWTLWMFPPGCTTSESTTISRQTEQPNYIIDILMCNREQAIDFRLPAGK